MSALTVHDRTRGLCATSNAKTSSPNQWTCWKKEAIRISTLAPILTTIGGRHFSEPTCRSTWALKCELFVTTTPSDQTE
ncbi:unnamed protein product [Periconia digitata]|uniref:Uncharacterized protein n=1 Tax=Periconia digitata TaxID=1303443 RepID=A0A9W4U0X2_9PLEO|nr:unnamed protein product [Periconia digitata]